MNVPFVDLRPGVYSRDMQAEIDAAIKRVAYSGYYVLGPEVAAFEQAFAAYHGVQYAIGVANGTDAIELALRCLYDTDMHRRDEVITVGFTAVPTVCAIERAGLKPVLVDIDPWTYTMNVEDAIAAITPRTLAILPVHLYGMPAQLERMSMIAMAHGIHLVEDCAQACGASWEGGKHVGTLGIMGCFSFYPTKTLGAMGDGGCIITNDDEYAYRVRLLRQYGQAKGKYLSLCGGGMNSRLDELQAAVLSVKLKYLDAMNRERRNLATLYKEMLPDGSYPWEWIEDGHVYHLFVIKHEDRDALKEYLASKGVQTMIHYPHPVHLQPAYRHLALAGSLPNSEEAAECVLSLPLYPGMLDEHVEYVCECIREWEKSR